jgi:Zn-dependent protease with chaperone function
MGAVHPRRRIDEQMTTSGTTVRFLLLVVLLLVSTGSMALNVIDDMNASADLGGAGCWLAAGADPFHTPLSLTLFVTDEQQSAFAACMAGYEPPPPWWTGPAWVILLLAAAVLLVRAQPMWKARRGRVVPLEAVDHDGEVWAAVQALAAQLPVLPRVVVDPAAASVGATVFGSNRRPVICLYGGSLVRRQADPEGFRAVLLHELAHVRNGDVTLTYSTVALWRAFLVIVLLPFAGFSAYQIVDGNAKMLKWSSPVPSARSIALSAGLVFLVYLVRADVLRTREIHADLTAVARGADLSGQGTWAVPASGRRRVFDALTRPLRTHPDWELRRRSLSDPAALFGLSAVLMFLTGTATMLVSAQLTNDLQTYSVADGWAVNLAPAAAAAALLTAVAGTALWRAVAHAARTGRRVPSGVRAGLWLGTGMILGALVTDQDTGTAWLPSQPAFLLLILAAAVAFTWWTTRCASLWIEAWPGRSLRPPTLLVMAGMFVVMTVWFQWWQRSGSIYTFGFPLNDSALPGDAPMPGSIALLLDLRIWFSPGPLIVAAVTALGGVPLLALAVRSNADPPSGLRPVSRQVLLAAAAGAIGGVLALAAAMAYMHTWQSSIPRQPGALAAFLLWVLGSWTVAPACAAGFASVRAVRHRLLSALIAAEIATLAGLALMFALTSSAGCVPALDALRESCAWQPGQTWPMFGFLLDSALALGAASAFVVTAAVTATGRARAALSARPHGAPLNRRTARRAAVACAVAAGITWAGLTWPTGVTGTAFTSSPSASAQVRGLQAQMWFSHGGAALIKHLALDVGGLTDLLVRSRGNVSTSGVAPFCRDLATVAGEAGDYFRIPDPQAQEQWQTLIALTRLAGQDCQGAVNRSDGALLLGAVSAAQKALAADSKVIARLTVVSRQAGLSGVRGTGRRRSARERRQDIVATGYCRGMSPKSRGRKVKKKSAKGNPRTARVDREPQILDLRTGPGSVPQVYDASDFRRGSQLGMLLEDMVKLSGDNVASQHVIEHALEASADLLKADGPRQLEQGTAELLAAELSDPLMYGRRSDLLCHDLAEVARNRVLSDIGLNNDAWRGPWWLLHGIASIGPGNVGVAVQSTTAQVPQEQPAWLGLLPGISATGEVHELRDRWGLRLGVIAEFAYPGGVDGHVYLLDIDASWDGEIRGAGVFDNFADAETAWRASLPAGEAGGELGPVTDETLACLYALAHLEELMSRDELLTEHYRAERRLAGILARSGSRPVTSPFEPEAEEFTAWYSARHGYEPEDDLAGPLADMWIQGVLPGTAHLVSPQRAIDFCDSFLTWIEADEQDVRKVLPEWIRWVGEKAGAAPDVIEESAAALGPAIHGPEGG